MLIHITTGELQGCISVIIGYSGDVDPPSPVILTPIKDDGSENFND